MHALALAPARPVRTCTAAPCAIPSPFRPAFPTLDTGWIDIKDILRAFLTCENECVSTKRIQGLRAGAQHVPQPGYVLRVVVPIGVGRSSLACN